MEKSRIYNARVPTQFCERVLKLNTVNWEVHSKKLWCKYFLIFLRILQRSFAHNVCENTNIQPTYRTYYYACKVFHLTLRIFIFNITLISISPPTWLHIFKFIVRIVVHSLPNLSCPLVVSPPKRFNNIVARKLYVRKHRDQMKVRELDILPQVFWGFPQSFLISTCALRTTLN